MGVSGDPSESAKGSGKDDRGGGSKGLTRYQRQQKSTGPKGSRSMTMGQSERRGQGTRENAEREKYRLVYLYR